MLNKILIKYKSFKNPIGLLVRMLKSRNRAARFMILREFLKYIALPLDVSLKPLERRALQKTKASDLPLILIIGGARSGTTLLYQTLAQYLSVSYFTNTSDIFSKSPIMATKIFNRFNSKSKPDFKNYFGYAAGFNAPSDGYFIWSRWLGDNRYAINNELTNTQGKEMRRFFDAWQEQITKPFLNKHNRNSMCVPFLNKTLANVYFIEIYRNPIFVIQSLIKSRLEIQGNKRAGWGLMNVSTERAKDPLGYIDDIAKQVYTVEMELKEARKEVNPNNYFRISYEKFCKDPKAAVLQITKKFSGIDLSDYELSNLEPFESTNTQRVTNDEFERINQCVKKLFGNNKFN